MALKLVLIGTAESARVMAERHRIASRQPVSSGLVEIGVGGK